MKNRASTLLPPPLILRAETAEELMTPNPVSIRQEATVREAVKFLTDRGISAAPVIDGAGRPVGVVSRADILVYDREKVEYINPVPDYYERPEVEAGAEEAARKGIGDGLDVVRVRDIMTPVVFSVMPGTPAAKVVECLLAWKVHRVFVIDPEGVLTGVISVLDVLRHLAGAEPAPGETAGWEIER